MNIIFKMFKRLRKQSNLVKNISIIALIIAVITGVITTVNYKSLYQQQEDLTYNYSTKYQEKLKENEKLNSQIKDYQENLKQKDVEIKNINKKLKEREQELQKLKEEINDSSNNEPEKETTSTKSTTKIISTNQDKYKESTIIWKYLTSTLSLNKYVAAGILGNIMVEVGGQSLDISNWPTYSKGYYYGICQWAGGRKSRLLNDFGTSLESQLEFLEVELFETIPRGKSFYNMQNEKDAALYFAKYYERCSSEYYSIRQTCATKALEYFS